MTLSLTDAISRLPLLAILRGIPPEEAEAVTDALILAGFAIIEVPLNSPDPYRSIEMLAKKYGGSAIIGAGTVLRPAEVERVKAAGGTIIVSPNFSEKVVDATKKAGLISVPGVFTPTEAFQALEAGADALKIFPGDAISPKVVKALRAVLPSETLLFVTGGVGADNLAEFLQAGANGAGVGSALYKPGKSLADLAADARHFADAAAKAKLS